MLKAAVSVATLALVVVHILRTRTLVEVLKLRAPDTYSALLRPNRFWGERSLSHRHLSQFIYSKRDRRLADPEIQKICSRIRRDSVVLSILWLSFMAAYFWRD